VPRRTPSNPRTSRSADRSRRAAGTRRAAAPEAPAAPSQTPRPRETAAARTARAHRVLALLRAAYPQATCALRHRSAYELLVATILSAQCTDERVNLVTPEVFHRWPDAAALAAADPAELEDVIRSTGFFRNKARSLLGMARLVCAEHGGRIPDTMDALVRLPGVARKTANCVLGTWYGRNDGIVVDTHVGRLAVRLGLAPRARDGKDAERIEQDLMELVPRDAWTWLSHALIEHGRRICTARGPQCAVCPLAPECPSAGRV